MNGLDMDKIVDEMNRVSELIEYEDVEDAAYMAGYGAAIIQLLSSFAEMIYDDLAKPWRILITASIVIAFAQTCIIYKLPLKLLGQFT